MYSPFVYESVDEDTEPEEMKCRGCGEWFTADELKYGEYCDEGCPSRSTYADASPEGKAELRRLVAALTLICNSQIDCRVDLVAHNFENIVDFRQKAMCLLNRLSPESANWTVRPVELAEDLATVLGQEDGR